VKDPVGDSTLIIKVVASNDISVRGRKDTPPGFLFDVSERKVSKNTWILLLNRFTDPPLTPGRWYFSVIGDSFLNTSDYTLYFDIQVCLVQFHFFILHYNFTQFSTLNLKIQKTVTE
jgi:hypothetical protein